MERLDLAIVSALRPFELDVQLSVGAETVALVGPSGAGKTTILRAIAGLRRPDRGRIALGDRAWFDSAARVDLAPERRSVGLVFQEYALFPHLSVRANVAFGGASRVDELLERFAISGLAGARPGTLSGGERQRVALARALAREPSVLLLDEPLSALDAHTRAAVRAELQDLLGELGLPALIVTHDFGDAAALADRIGVVIEGRLRQIGTAAELVERPADAFVVSLTGGNLLTGTALPRRGGGSEVVLDAGGVVCSRERARGRIGVVVYPWEITVRAAEDADGSVNEIVAPIAALTPEGGRVRVRMGPLTAECAAEDVERLDLRRGGAATASFSPSDARLIALDGSAASGEAIPALHSLG
ncbi:MAG: molybdate transport system ATP-binding protein [Solirubrobacteraceae bacterium]|nr:molybdate transport system ATP-binding protein [Solirubrobacteraceae bacterium]